MHPRAPPLTISSPLAAPWRSPAVVSAARLHNRKGSLGTTFQARQKAPTAHASICSSRRTNLPHGSLQRCSHRVRTTQAISISNPNTQHSPHKLVKHALVHNEALRPRTVLAARLEGAAQRGGQHLREGGWGLVEQQGLEAVEVDASGSRAS